MPHHATPEEVVGTKAAEVGLAHPFVLEAIDHPLLVVEVAVHAHQLVCAENQAHGAAHEEE